MYIYYFNTLVSHFTVHAQFSLSLFTLSITMYICKTKQQKYKMKKKYNNANQWEP